MKTEQGLIVFLGLPVLFFIAFFVLSFIAHKREGIKLSLLKNMPYEAFSDVNPALAYPIRILFILYIASSIPFYAYLTFFASKYGTMYLSLTATLLLLSVIGGFSLFMMSFAKMSATRKHLVSFIVFAISSMAISIMMAQFFNVTRKMHVFSVDLDIALLIATIVSALPALFDAVVLANKRLMNWSHFDKEKDKVYFLALAEWLLIFFSLLSLIINVVGFFLIQ